MNTSTHVFGWVSKNNLSVVSDSEVIEEIKEAQENIIEEEQEPTPEEKKSELFFIEIQVPKIDSLLTRIKKFFKI